MIRERVRTTMAAFFLLAFTAFSCPGTAGSAEAGAVPGKAKLTRAELEGAGIKHLLATGRRKGKRHDLFVLDLGGGVVKQLTDTPEKSELQTRCSPDGKWIAYTIQRAKISYIDEWCDAWLMKPDGSGARRIMEKVHNVSWNRDSRRMAFGTGRDPDKEWSPMGFRILDLETSEVKWVAKQTGGILDLCWADGEIFAYRVANTMRNARISGGVYYHNGFSNRPLKVAKGCHTAITRDGDTMLNNWTSKTLGLISNLKKYAETKDDKVLVKRSLIVPKGEACAALSENGKYAVIQGTTKSTLRIIRVADFATFDIVGDGGKLAIGGGRGGYWADFVKPATVGRDASGEQPKK